MANEAGDAASAPVWRSLASGPVRRAPASAGDEAGQPPASPRLRALQADLARTRSPGHKKRLLREFWQAVQAQGAPLLEETAAQSATPAPSGDAAPAARLLLRLRQRSSPSSGARRRARPISGMKCGWTGPYLPLSRPRCAACRAQISGTCRCHCRAACAWLTSL